MVSSFQSEMVRRLGCSLQLFLKPSYNTTCLFSLLLCVWAAEAYIKIFGLISYHSLELTENPKMAVLSLFCLKFKGDSRMSSRSLSA